MLQACLQAQTPWLTLPCVASTPLCMYTFRTKDKNHEEGDGHQAENLNIFW
jgi:hypothetical protein